MVVDAGRGARTGAAGDAGRVSAALAVGAQFTPLDDAGLRRRPGPGEGTPAAAPARRPEDLFRAVPTLSPPWSQGKGVERRFVALPDVLLSLAGRPNNRPLVGLVGRTAVALQKERQTLVVDAAALGAAGVDPTAALTIPPQASADEAPPWEAMGLASAPTPAGPLLTTKCQWANGARRRAGAPPEAVAAAVAEAATRGRDSSGRFPGLGRMGGIPSR